MVDSVACNCEAGGERDDRVHSVVADEFAMCRASQVEVRFASTKLEFTPDVEAAKRIVGVDLPGAGAAAQFLRGCTNLRLVTIADPVDADMEAMAALSQLAEVGIHGNSVTANTLLHFFGAMRCAGLRSFACRPGSQLRADRDIARVLSHPALESLEALSMAKLGPLAAGVVSRGFSQLARLSSEFSSDSMTALARGAGLQRLTRLSAYGQKLDHKAMAALCSAGFSSRLVVLNLGATGMDASTLRVLCSHPLPSLRDLSLHRNAIDTEGLGVLLTAPWHKQLVRLGLSHNHLDDAAQARLREVPALVSALRATGQWDEAKRAVYSQTRRR